MTDTMGGAPAEVLAGFIHRLRDAGLTVGPMTTADLAEASDLVGLGRAEDVYYGFRGLCVTHRDQIPVFDRIFVETFGRGMDQSLHMVRPRRRTWAIDAGASDDGRDQGAEELGTVVGATDWERLADRDFATLDSREQAAVRSLIAKMRWSPADARGRRRQPATGGDRPDLRRSLRHAVGPDSDLIPLVFDERRRRRRPLVVLADVSGSMERYSEMLLYFLHAAGGTLGKVEAFVFATRITRVTRELRGRNASMAIAAVSEAVEDWSGGTRIGESIGRFNRDWSRRVVRGGPVALIISDGWERGDPEVLAFEMARLARTTHRVIWLNPLAGREGFAPETRGMMAALPHVDDFLPVGNLNDLATLVAVLESIPEVSVR